MSLYSISRENLFVLLRNLAEDYSVFVPVKKGENRFYKNYSDISSLLEKTANGKGIKLVVGEVRAFEPLKLFFLRARERVAVGFRDESPSSRQKPYCIVGAKACDLKGFKIQDKVFISEDYRDPFYIEQREDNLVISADCTSAIDTCFCLSLHGDPFPKENFDINLSEINAGFVVESGSERGESFITRNASLFHKPGASLIAERDAQRKRVADGVRENITKHGIPDQDEFSGIIEKNYDAPLWKEEAEECVECGACNAICPTCHCFLLYDQQSEENLVRLRLWDSCMIKDFAKVAGGANPRPNLWMRLRNRFEKKFDFFPKVNDIYACTGCGRCISACPAKIDIRRVLKRLVENV